MIGHICNGCHRSYHLAVTEEILTAIQNAFHVHGNTIVYPQPPAKLTFASEMEDVEEIHHQWFIGFLFYITQAVDEIISSTNRETCLFVILEELEMALKMQ